MIKDGKFEEAIGDDEELGIFTRRLHEFDEAFCYKMFMGMEFTLKMEVHGNRGRIIHCRVVDDSFDRPNWVKKK